MFRGNNIYFKILQLVCIFFTEVSSIANGYVDMQYTIYLLYKYLHLPSNLDHPILGNYQVDLLHHHESLPRLKFN